MFSPKRLWVLALLLCCSASLRAAESDTKPAAPANAADASKLAPIKVPTGPGWDAFLKNDFAAAEAAFRQGLEKDPRNLLLLEGLRAALVAAGRYKESQAVNLQMVASTLDSPLCGAFAIRAIDALPFVESRETVRDAFIAAMANATPANAAMLKDHVATLYRQQNKTAEAQKALQGLGYIDHWLLVAGPFGAKDKNNPIEKRFAPERSLKDLENVGGEKEKVQVHQDVKTTYRELNLGLLFPGGRGIFYAFTNLESDSDQDVVLGVSANAPYRVWLRGLPVLAEPEDDQPRRPGGELIRTRLVKGANPILVKLPNAAPLVVRVLSADFAPLPSVRVAADPQVIANHSVTAVRGVLLAQKTCGSLARHFAPEIAELKKRAENGELTLADASWLDFALQRESETAARITLARRVAASFPESAGPLDLSAYILSNAGGFLGDSSAREDEEARHLREQALAKVPDAHQHLLALFRFFLEHNLDEQALTQIKLCAEKHPDSPMAQAELGEMWQRKQFLVEAEKCFEKAATLDRAFLGRLIAFHEVSGNRARAQELRKKQVELGIVDLGVQFEQAIKRGTLDEAEQILKGEETAYPERKDEWAQARVRLLQERGELKDAYELEKKVFAAQPKDSGERRNTLVALIELSLRLNKDAEVRELLKGFLKDHPNDSELRQRLSDLDGNALPHWWEPYDVNVRQIDTSHYTGERYPSANHAWIVDFMVAKVLPDMSTESYTHIAQKVLNLQGIGELSELLVRAQRNEMLFVRTVNPDGAVFEPQNVHDFNLAQSASLYKVGPGSILEHAYITNTPADEDEPSLQMGFNFNAIDAPRAVSRWVVMLPDSLKAKVKIRKIRPEMIDEQILPGPAGYTVYQWTNKQVEGIKREALMPIETDQEVIPLVTIESGERPFRATGWLMRREKNQLPPEATAQAKQLAAAAGADEGGKFDAIVNWVRENIRPGDDSRTISDVWFLRAGRPDQMTTLALEMSRAASLNVRMAYVNGSYAPGRVWHTKNAERLWDPAVLASFGNAGHMLNLEQSSGPDRWAQFVGRQPKYYWPADLNFGQAGALALTTGDDGLRIKRVRGEMLGYSGAVGRMQVNLDKDGNGDVSGSLNIYGNMGGTWREALADPRQEQQVKEYVVRYAWPKGKVGDIRVTGTQSSQQPLVFTYTCKVEGLGSLAGGAVFLKPFLNQARILDLRGPPQREHDLVIRDEFSDLDHTLTYVAPKGSAWVEVPDDVLIVTEFGWYLVDYNVQGQKLTATRSFLMPQQRIAPEKYPKLQDFLRQISAAEEQRIAHAPLQAQSFGGLQHDVFSPGYASCGDKAAQKENAAKK
ncbi:MAG TPA: hypothetical protein VGP72_32155 [Planctomycetota bacterium]|jgi:tetratricopeptide (TPR) repeat protein